MDVRFVAQAALHEAERLVLLWLPDGRREGREWVARNPTRADKHFGSFKVNVTTGRWSDFATGDRGGDLVSLYAYLHHFEQAEAGRELAEALGLSTPAPEKPYNRRSCPAPDTIPLKAQWEPRTPIPEDAPPPPETHYKHGRPAFVWTYRDTHGAALLYLYRFDLADKHDQPVLDEHGKPKKVFTPLTFCRNNAKCAWRWQALPVPRPLYNLDRLADNPTAIVIFCEGEKGADAAAVLFPRCVTTTTLNGAKSPQKTDFSPLQGRTVWLWPDQDEPGRNYAEQVAALVDGIAKEVRRLQIPGDHPEGWDAADAFEEGWHPELGYELLEIALLKRPAKISLLGEGFKVKESGVWYHPPVAADEDREPPVWICSPLEVNAYTRNDEGEAWGRLLEFKDAEGRAHRWAMPMRLLQSEGTEYRAILADMGLVIAPGRKARDLLTRYIQSAKPSGWARCVEHTGWHGDAFVFPDETVGNTNGERVFFQTVSARRHVYRQAGTLEDWQRHVATLCVGNARLLFSVSCGFGSMLLAFSRDENGGFHFRGPSSFGKTTVLSVASSVFGCGDLRNGGYMHTWRTTGNGLESVASLHSDTLLCLDELKQVDPKEAGEIVYTLANGANKSRADRMGLARERQTWRLLFLSSGELSLADHLGAAGKRVYAGEETRLADIPVDTGRYGAFENLHGYKDGREFSFALNERARTYYGVASREFVRRLTAHERIAETVSSVLQETRREFAAYFVPEDASGQVQRVAMRFALVAAGGELATKLGITGWSEGAAVSAAAACFNAWLAARGGAGNQEVEIALSRVRRFFELHGESRFTPWEDTVLAGDFRTMNRAGFRRANSAGESEFYVLREVFKSDICEGLDWRFVARVLAERKLLVLDEKGRSTRKERLPGLGSLRCYHFAAGILAEA